MKKWKKFQHWIENDEQVFQEACKVAGVEPNARQHGKWRQGRGEAYRKRTTAKKRIVQAARKRWGDLEDLS